jgi:hypothetical protein
LAADRARLPAAYIHRTRSGALEFVFRDVPGVRNSRGRLVKGVDMHGERSCVIWWPAIGSPVVCDAPPAPQPRWFLDALLSPKMGPKPTVRSSVKRFHPANDNLIDQTPEVWTPHLGRNVSPEDARRIIQDVAGFFAVLTEWSRAEARVPANDIAKPSRLDAGEVSDESRNSC